MLLGHLRVGPTHPKRRWWALAHHNLGRAAVLLAWANVYIGIYMYHTSIFAASYTPWITPIAIVMGLLVGRVAIDAGRVAVGVRMMVAQGTRAWPGLRSRCCQHACSGNASKARVPGPRLACGSGGTLSCNCTSVVLPRSSFSVIIQCHIHRAVGLLIV